MKEYIQAVGDTGKLIIQDKTDTVKPSQKYVDLYIQSMSPVAIPQLPWRWYTDEQVGPTWKSFNFKNTTLRQHLGLVYVGYAHQFTLVLGNTGTSQLDGPTEFGVDLATLVRTVSVKVGTVYKDAIPYVNVNGVWQRALVLVYDQDAWKEAT